MMKKPAADTRQHILDVARSLMTVKGYTAVGLGELLSQAGVPKGSFYHYFRSKEEFGEALLHAYFSEYLTRVDALMAADGTGAERIVGYFQYWARTQGTDVLEGKCLVVKLGSEVCDLSEDMRAVLDTGTQAIVKRIASTVAEGQADGSIKSKADARELGESLYQIWLGASLMAKLGKSEVPFANALGTTQRLLAH